MTSFVPLDREDQRDVYRDALGDDRGDRGQACLGRRDLDQHVRPVDDLPQLDGLQNRLVGVVREAGIDLDRHPTVDAARTLVGLREHVTRVADVVGGDGADRGVDVGAALRELLDLVVVGVALGQRGLEDRRVGGDAHDASRIDEVLQVAGLQPLARQVVEPYGYARGAQRREVRVLSHCCS